MLILYHSDKIGAQKQSYQIKSRLDSFPNTKTFLVDLKKKIPEKILSRTNLIISVGGDGTLLKVSHLAAPRRIPVLGVNIGRLGFLAEAEKKSVAKIVKDVIAGKYNLEERMMLKVNSFQNNQQKLIGIALNDCVIHSPETGHPITITTFVEDNFLTNYHGDGLIIATPTGSTAYSLAAGGPIVHPHLELFLLTPICPHTLAQRPLLISATHRIKIRTSNAAVYLDGNYQMKLSGELLLSRYEFGLMLVRHPQLTYLDVLRTKLGWGER